MNAKQRRAHVRELTELYKNTVPAEFNSALVSELIDAGKDAKRQEDTITQLRSVLSEQEATIKALMSDNVEMRTQNSVAHKMLDEWLNVAANCSIESGCCCCGDDMARHSSAMSCGHSPVDMADALVLSLVEKSTAALAKWREWKDKA